MKRLRQGLLGRIRHIHLVGIGGAGMSAIAEVLLNNGLKVSGSDLNASDVTDRLKERGAIITVGHNAENIDGAEVVAHSSAVRVDENPETLAAMKLGVPVIKRDELLGEMMRRKAGICIAGTHGKTTTTTMIATMLAECNLEPTALIGGVSDYFLSMGSGGSALVGDGDLMVIEADEYDRTFLKLTPTIAVMTTLEAEHLDIYKDIDDLKQAFTEFGNKVPFYGAVVLCNDEENLRAIRPNLKRKTITYGLNADAEFRAIEIEQAQATLKFKVMVRNQSIGIVGVEAAGMHNVKNALAAIAVGFEIGLNFEDIRRGLAKFKSVRRRFQIRFERGAHAPIVVDDYAHHPTEVRATIEAAKCGFKSRKVVAVFQPHLYSRTRDFASEFASALSLADRVIITDVYPSRERAEDFEGVTSQWIADKVPKSIVVEKSNLVDALSEEVKGNELVVMMGAGDITKSAEKFAQVLERKYGG
ncbi:MAG: UDP-N-acetylmuramate--L-alanine ligase [Chloroherpetonaceae bacterium]